MAMTKRHLMAGLLIMMGLAGASRPAVAAGADAPAMPHVRSSNATIAALIIQATEQSQTFRGLIETINASDGIVYVEEGTCGHGVRACFVSVTTAGANRMLWVKVDTRKADWDLMGSIAHELRHTIEVLGERTIATNAGMFMFYSRIGSVVRGNRFETKAALDTGSAVRAEVKNHRKSAEAN